MFCLLPQYNTMQYKSLFLHPGHTNLAYEEHNTILKGGTLLLDR